MSENIEVVESGDLAIFYNLPPRTSHYYPSSVGIVLDDINYFYVSAYIRRLSADGDIFTNIEACLDLKEDLWVDITKNAEIRSYKGVFYGVSTISARDHQDDFSILVDNTLGSFRKIRFNIRSSVTHNYGHYYYNKYRKPRGKTSVDDRRGEVYNPYTGRWSFL